MDREDQIERADQIERDDEIERLVRERVGVGYTVTGGPVWLELTPPGLDLPDDGWKLHISSRASTFRALIDAVLPVLLGEGCAFKLARSQRALSELNDGISRPASVGKAITIYPRPERFRELGLVLAERLRGHEGPRVLSDRRISASSPVYYRFGPFTAKRAFDARGRLDTSVRGPGGEEVDAVATLRYRQPTWTVDPFTGEIAAAAPGPVVVLGGRYRLVGGIREAAQGSVFRAQDLRSGASVVIKQARALVAEHGDGNDARLRLRNERRVLAVLDGVAGVPRFIDHFRHGPDEFLVTSDCGADNLVEKVRRSGPYRPGVGRGFRSLERLGAQLAGILGAIHGRGVVVRDLSPKNVVVTGAAVSIVDFGLAYHDGLHLPGLTPGYAPARQHADEPPRDTDDLHALGLTLLFAASGLHPVRSDDDPDLARVRALAAISAGYGQRPSGVMALIADLLSGECDGPGETQGELARRALRRLAAGPGGAVADSGPRSLPRPPVMTGELAAEITDNLLHDLVDHVHKILRAPSNSQAANDASIYSGTAGIGLELLRHADRPAVADCLPDLVRFTTRITRTALRAGLPQGLFTGVTGVHVFLAQARQLGLTTEAEPGFDLSNLMPSSDWTPEGDDLIVGAAGVGLGHLFLHRTTGDPAHLRVAAKCARQLMNSTIPVSAFTPDRQPGRGRRENDRPRIGVDQSAGRAHGLAGLAAFLLSWADHSGDADPDPGPLNAAAERLRHLTAQTRPLLAQARHPAATPMAASWCQGLTGIGQTFLSGGAALGDPELTAISKEAANASLELLPRLETLGQCCGAAGLGTFVIDLATAETDDRYWSAAQDIATHILLRSAGRAGHPDFTAELGEDDLAGWATGLTGQLAFFRRLASPGAPDLLPVPITGRRQPCRWLGGSTAEMRA